MENVTSSFSYKWIKYHKFLDRTGICFSFQYKITGDNNTLSMYFATLSGKKTLVWKIHGNHGNVWKYGEITYWPSENLSFIFEGQVIQPDTMVAIANILVKTESCNVKVQPLYADPEYICSPKKFECGNGQCIKKGYQCDGDRYCADGSDELFCECLADQVKCEESARCVDARKLCNGLKDCDDGSDERNCDSSCEHGQFYCPSGLCIPWNLTCDGIWDCPDGADEPHVCYWTTEFDKKRCPLNDLSCFEESANLTFCEKFAEGSCDFERSGLCNWEQVLDGGDNFDWSINSGSTPSKFTGPNVDHTTGSIEGRI
ncbi:MAM and LDL-receptor class A domain-containing protein 1-like [Dendronephthya gigantea]|uniref:MAM and LDL-receptor class A domain-containing protein 1-like n=1 Tax=Dendronephthya gigantea TaxID=151771 RepID=UPI00106C35EF|nr:MAM and LDL-receptor class A domain-containing protein 1-like [Dendronephthya gigantea]